MSTDVEEVWAAALNSDKRVTAAACLFRGTVDQCLTHPRDIFRFGCLHNAAALVLAHNHPSGQVRPSRQDLEWTRRIKEAAEILMIPVVDHLILGQRSYFSFMESGLLKILPEGDEKQSRTEY